MHKLEHLLKLINICNQKYDEIERISGANFNIFSILKLERKEVKNHSLFIYELLNINGSHGKGDLFLKLFFKKVLKLEHYDELKSCVVKREDSTKYNRYIDFTIETDKHQIGIEMKIDAKDGEHQLYDYYQELKERQKNEQKAILYYLTLYGQEPSERSIKKSRQKLTTNQYKQISFDIEIIDWLEECIKESATTATVRELLIQYLNSIKNITHNSHSKDQIMEVTNILTQGDNLKVYLEAEESVLEAKIQLQLKFFLNLKEKLNKDGLEFEFILPENNNSLHQAIAAYYRSKCKTCYSLDLKLSDEYTIQICLGNAVRDPCLYFSMDNIKTNKMRKGLQNNHWVRNEGGYTWYWKYSSTRLNFYNPLDTLEVLDLFDDKNLNQVTDEIVNELSKDIEILKAFI